MNDHFSRNAATRCSHGRQPMDFVTRNAFSRNVATRGVSRGIRVAPLGLDVRAAADHGLTPVATACRPVGTELQANRVCPNPSRAMRLAATRRHVVAMGVSPWNADPKLRFSPNGATRGVLRGIPVAPLGLDVRAAADHGLTPVATACRPIGTESQANRVCPNPSRAMRLAATRRHDVAMGVSPWNADPKLRFSPNGATRGVSRGIRVAPLGLGVCGAADFGKTCLRRELMPLPTSTSKGLDLRAIAGRLESEKILTKSGNANWTHTAVQSILRRAAV